MVVKKNIKHISKSFINVFELRFRILKMFYENFLLEDNPVQLQDIHKEMKPFVTNERLNLTSFQYLLIYGYINKTQKDEDHAPIFSITPKGIKFVENITLGDIEMVYNPKMLQMVRGGFATYNNDITNISKSSDVALSANSKELEQ